MQIPGFKMERVIAEGGMSSVYLALQESLGRSVAVKTLDRIGTAKDARRFLHEARIIASLQHRNIITIHDVGEVGGRYYIAMEYLEGGSLTDKIEEGMSPKQALDLLESIASCLDFVHRRGIVHGDIKPANILFDRDGTPKLSDFGIAERGKDHRHARTDGKIYGSPHYLSPEQADGLPRDGRSDIYGLGIVFYRMLTGQLPYEADSDVGIIIAHLSRPIPLLPEGLSGCQRLLEKMIAKRPADRVRDAGELLKQIRETRALMTRRGRLIDAVSRLLPAEPVPRRRIWPSAFKVPTAGGVASGAVVVLVVMLGLGVLSYKAAPDRTAAAEAVIVGPGPVEEPAPRRSRQPPEPAVAVDSGMSPPPADLALTNRPMESGPPAPTDSARPNHVEQPLEGERKGPAESAAILSDTEPAEIGVPEGPGQPQHSPEKDSESVSRPPTDDGAAPVADVPVPARDDEKIAGWIRAAERALAANRLTTPADDNAYDRYRSVLDLEPNHPAARTGLNRIAKRYATLGRGALAAGKPALARLYLGRGVEVRGDHPALQRLREELEAAARLADAQSQADPPEAVEVVSAPDPGSAFDFEKVGDPSRGGQGTGNIIKDFRNAWRSLFD